MNKSYYGFLNPNTGKRRTLSIKPHSITCSHCGRTFSHLTTVNCSHCGHVITSDTRYRKHAKETGKLFKEDKKDKAD